mmetsp:Transcript_486/g.932  ORF Transcript_486/g.932 Transcript_486/m.932 type:complete len:227 (+) Transcript_486:151-831(+)
MVRGEVGFSHIHDAYKVRCDCVRRMEDPVDVEPVERPQRQRVRDVELRGCGEYVPECPCDVAPRARNMKREVQTESVQCQYDRHGHASRIGVEEVPPGPTVERVRHVALNTRFGRRASGPGVLEARQGKDAVRLVPRNAIEVPKEEYCCLWMAGNPFLNLRRNDFGLLPSCKLALDIKMGVKCNDVRAGDPVSKSRYVQGSNSHGVPILGFLDSGRLRQPQIVLLE